IPGTADDVMSTNPAGPDGVLGTADDITQAGDPETWAIGARVGVAGFTFGGSYAENDSGAQFGVGDTEGWSLGVTYDLAGPWTVGFDTYQGEATVSTIASAGVNVKDEYQAYQIGAERELGTGVAWRIYAIQSETSRTTTNPAGLLAGSTFPVQKTSAESTAVGTGIRLNF
ncbi:MAG TPA: porin, partial [Roseovarius sp.]|nr:porin [Roseovarius sp.]